MYGRNAFVLDLIVLHCRFVMEGSKLDIMNSCCSHHLSHITTSTFLLDFIQNSLLLHTEHMCLMLFCAKSENILFKHVQNHCFCSIAVRPNYQMK